MASFTSRRIGTLSLPGKKYKIQAAQKDTELFQRNSREGGLKKEENRSLERGGWKNKNNKTQLNRDKTGGRSDLKQEWGAQPSCGHPLCEQDKIAGHAMVEEPSTGKHVTKGIPNTAQLYGLGSFR